MKGGFEPASLESEVEHSTTEPKPLLSANELAWFFFFHQNFMRSAMPKFLLRKRIFQCIFQTATVSSVFQDFKRVTHNFTQFLTLFHVLHVT